MMSRNSLRQRTPGILPFIWALTIKTAITDEEGPSQLAPALLSQAHVAQPQYQCHWWKELVTCLLHGLWIEEKGTEETQLANTTRKQEKK